MQQQVPPIQPKTTNNPVQVPPIEPPPKPPTFEPVPPPSISMIPIKKEDVMNVSITESNGSDGPDDILRKLRRTNFKRKVSGREKRLRQNRKLKRLLIPRNACVALHELSGHEASAISDFQVKQNGNQFVAEVTVNNVKYEGYGTSKMAAKNNASEKALRDLIVTRLQQQKIDGVKMETVEQKELEAVMSDNQDVDMETDGEQKEGSDIPMLQLASFALHKLLAEWEAQGYEIPLFKNDGVDKVSESGTSTSPKAPKPGKVRNDLPPNAETMHPVVLLSHMRPCTTYMDLGSQGTPPNITHTVGCQVDGENFVGAGRSKKDARRACATEVLKKLFKLYTTAS
jgi:hypothetical protein